MNGLALLVVAGPGICLRKSEAANDLGLGNLLLSGAIIALATTSPKGG